MSEESIEPLKRALFLSPAAPERDAWLLEIGDVHLMAGRFDEALDWALRSRGNSRQIALRDKILGATLAHLGRQDEARAAIARVNAVRPGQTIKLILGKRIPHPWDRNWIEGLVKAGIPRN